MERLTIKGATEPVCARKCEYGSSLDCYDCDKHKELLNRLAAYEDTGLEPEEVKEITSWSYGPFHKKMGDWLKAEHEGRLVVLPCKVGDTVYFRRCLGDKEPSKTNFSWIELVENANRVVGILNGSVYNFDFCDFGKTWFTTREGAEKALKGVSEDA